MTPYGRRQTPFTKRMAEDMQVRNLSPRTIDSYTFGHTPKKLPNVLGSDEVARLIACVRVPKHRAVLLTLYAAGLRLTEATNLKIQDIDSARMQLKVVLGKGRKDRYVPISPKLLKELRDYWQIAKPTIYLFPGKTPDVPLHGATIQICCKLAAAQARLNKHVTPHTLRHSYATGLLEAGVDLMAISNGSIQLGDLSRSRRRNRWECQ